MMSRVLAKDDVAPILHLYSPAMPHEESRIVANREGLKRLRDAIDATLQGKRLKPTTFTADGEGGDLIIGLVEGDVGAKAWEKVSLPYAELRDQKIEASEIDKLQKIQAAACEALDKAKEMQESFEGAINWGDLRCSAAMRLLFDDGSWEYEVLIEEAAPENSSLHAYVSEYLGSCGYSNVSVRSEW